ncbi:uncharacterized protein A1O9_12111 [Exophiala aquamarina CBS 119918]|uniref:Uncharacterized protein n=1 Tax=Exophiala aquamarina CBS 119918 TaxID=1182545 RepID=A0A072NV98_9EURO|nr:uncharacterized protein A1O9_12111 [Exophiala aquamarina CBS 119918]KEF51774.1 hypothetical protein A1O9_12111 [Exophiala aquamarina CBS 119918]
MDIPSTDEEFRSAIQALQASTKAIEHQTRIINSQAAYLKNWKTSDDAADHRRSSHASYLSQREAAEIQHVTFVVELSFIDHFSSCAKCEGQNEQLLDDLRADLQSESESIAKDVKSVHSVVSQVLNADDRALAKLNDRTTRHPNPTIDTGDKVQRVTQLASALQYFRVQVVKDRLDYTYLRRLNELSSPEGEESMRDPAVSSTTVKEIQQDLGSLYDEIDDIVTMAVRHEHTGPIGATLHQIDAAWERQGKAMAEQVHSRLSTLTESLEQLSSRLETIHSQRTILRNLALRTESLQQQPNPPARRLARATRAGGASAAETGPTDTKAQPALSKLLQHLSLHDTTNPAPSQIPHPHPLPTAIQKQTIRLQTESTQHVSEILTASEKAATRRREILDAVAKCIVGETSEKNARDLGDLEAVVNGARLRMERRA